MIALTTVESATYQFPPQPPDGIAIRCDTPRGWIGWKEAGATLDEVEPLNRKLIASARATGTTFFPARCKFGDFKCPFLDIESRRLEPFMTRDHKQLVVQFVEYLNGQRDPPFPKVVHSFRLGLDIVEVYRFTHYTGDEILFCVLVKDDKLFDIYVRGKHFEDVPFLLNGINRLAQTVRLVNIR